MKKSSCLYDYWGNWKNRKLSDTGKILVKSIIFNNSFDIFKFKKYLN